MEAVKSEFLASLDSEFAAAGRPASALAIAPAKRKPKVKRYWFAMVLSMAGALLVVNPAPASASCSDAFEPSFVQQSHIKYCGLGTYGYDYKYWNYAGANTICYNFQAWAFICSPGSRYDRGAMQACRTY